MIDDSLTLDEVDNLRSVLLTSFHIESTHCSNGKGKVQYLIRIPKRELLKYRPWYNLICLNA